MDRGDTGGRTRSSGQTRGKWVWSEDEWNEIYKETARRVFKFLMAQLGNPDAAEEALHETFVRFFIHFAKYDPQRPLLPWLLGIARRVAFAWLRDNPPVDSFDAAHLLPENLSEQRSPELRQTDARLVINSIIEQMGLNEEMAEIFYLCAVDGMKPAQIAEVLGLPRKAVRQRLHRIRGKIKCRLDKDTLL